MSYRTRFKIKILQSYNSYLSLCNISNMRGSHYFNKRGNSNNQYMQSRYNPQQCSLNQQDQQGQPSYLVRTTNNFNTYRRNQGNSDITNSHVDLHFYKNQNQASISQHVHQNGNYVPIQHRRILTQDISTHHRGNDVFQLIKREDFSLKNIITQVLSCSNIEKWRSASSNMTHYEGK